MNMVTPEYVAEMARYNAWQNDVVYDVCDGLPDAERTRDRGMYFASIHRTLDHIAMVDAYLLDTLTTGTAPHFDPAATVHDDWASLGQARAALDKRIGALAEQVDTAWLAVIIEVWSARLGRLRRLPRALYVMQMFNHQTHHRSQVTSELWKLGIDYGVTDIPFHPNSPY
jgi:uncharacterized damage-inducible protein DinB